MTYLPLHSAHALIDALVDALHLTHTEVRPEERREAFALDAGGYWPSRIRTTVQRLWSALRWY